MSGKDVERRKWNFPFRLDQSTRWLDNDMYAHLNNGVYSLLADSINNTYLIDHCGLEPGKQPDLSSNSNSKPISSSIIGLVISSSASYYAPASFPNRLQTGLRVIQLGSSSVTYEVGIFEVPPPNSEAKSSSMSEQNGMKASVLPDNALACCIVRTTHVFVDRITRRPVKPMPEQLYKGLSSIIVERFLLEKQSNANM